MQDPTVLGTLADLAEKAKQMPARRATLPSASGSDGHNPQANYSWLHFLAAMIKSKKVSTFVSHSGKAIVKLHQCVSTCVNILFGSESNTHTPDPAQIDRVAGWFEQAKDRAKSQGRPNPWLLNGLGNLREQQGRISDAEELYRLAIQEDDRDGISLNNLAWLAAFSKDEREQRGPRLRQSRDLLLNRISPTFSTLGA